MGYSFNNVPAQLEIGGDAYNGYFIVDTVATDINLTEINLYSPLAGISSQRVMKAFLDLYIPMISNNDAVNWNSCDGVQYIKTKRTGAATWANAIVLNTHDFYIPPSTSNHYGVYKGNYDITTGVQNSLTYKQNLQICWFSALSEFDNMYFYNVQPVVRVVLY